MKKKYDPLWEIVDEKIALQGQDIDLDAACPRCHVSVHVGSGAKSGDRFCCGLCGASFVITERSNGGSVAAKEIGQRPGR